VLKNTAATYIPAAVGLRDQIIEQYSFNPRGLQTPKVKRFVSEVYMSPQELQLHRMRTASEGGGGLRLLEDPGGGLPFGYSMHSLDKSVAPLDLVVVDHRDASNKRVHAAKPGTSGSSTAGGAASGGDKKKSSLFEYLESKNAAQYDFNGKNISVTSGSDFCETFVCVFHVYLFVFCFIFDPLILLLFANVI
jgi:hypothetical protein